MLLLALLLTPIFDCRDKGIAPAGGETLFELNGLVTLDADLRSTERAHVNTGIPICILRAPVA